MLNPGEIVHERYRILEQVGAGAMGAVYRAQHLTLTHRMVALKVVHPQLTTDPDFLRRFEREAQNASRVEHPNAVAVYDYGTTEQGLPYLAMEFVDGPSLAEHIAARREGIPLPEVANLIGQVAAALAAVHARGIVHRDLKPENIVLRADGQAKVLDFGIARATEGTRLSQTGLAIGTPAYMSPEQWRGEELDGRADQYALGVIVYEMLCGRAPFVSNTATGYMHHHLMQEPPGFADVQGRARVPLAVEAVVRRALEKDPARRYETVDAFASALRSAAERGLRPRSRREDRATGPEPTRSTALRTAAAVAALAVLGAGFVYWRAPEVPLAADEAPLLRSSFAATEVPSGRAPAEPGVLRVVSDVEGMVQVGGRDHAVAPGSPVEVQLAPGVFEVVVRSKADPELEERHPTVRLAAGETTEIAAGLRARGSRNADSIVARPAAPTAGPGHSGAPAPVVPAPPAPSPPVTTDLRDKAPAKEAEDVWEQAAPAAEPPPPATRTAVDLSGQPSFTPYEIKPELRDRAEFARSLTREYPPMLRDAGIEGTVVLWVFIDESGAVKNTKITQSSGYSQLDAVAQTVLSRTRFTPATNGGERVPVWIQLPVAFQTP